MRPVILRGRLVSLAVPRRDDAIKAWAWYNDRAVRKNLPSPDEIFFIEDEVEWYEALRKHKERDRVFSILENSSQTLVGFIGLHDVDHLNGRAEIGYFLGKDYWGYGYASEAVKLALEYAFEWLNLRKVYAFVFETNPSSIRVLEKNGFTQAGRWKKHQYVPGEGFVDVIMYERFRE